MTWATALGVSGISAVVITLVAAFLSMVGKVLTLGDERNAEEIGRMKAERQRDDAATKVTALAAELDETKSKLASTTAALEAAQSQLLTAAKERVDAAEGDDLVTISHGVLGPHVPGAGPASGSAPAGGRPEAAPVRGT